MLEAFLIRYIADLKQHLPMDFAKNLQAEKGSKKSLVHDIRCHCKTTQILEENELYETKWK